MLKKYSDEKNIQLLIALLKAHDIKDIVVSPGATNVSFVASCQQDSYFNIYSCVDERSAAYIACGIAAEIGNPVVLSCTGATASRNYLSGLTEAYYRKLPILAVTSSRPNGWIGNDIQQVTDRRNPPADTALLSAQIPVIHDADEEWAYTVKLNEALLELRHRGGGPVHINLQTTYSSDFSVEYLPDVPAIYRVCIDDAFPEIENGKIGICVGAHKAWSKELTAAVDAFCEKYDAVVLCDQTSNYRGEYRILSTMVCSQRREESGLRNFDLLIHIGDITGATFRFNVEKVWRVCEDGRVKDPLKKLRMVFEMSELRFFSYYGGKPNKGEKMTKQFEEWMSETKRLYDLMPELPFSNMWVAQQTIPQLPENSALHLGIYNTLRSWDFFDTPSSVNCYCNTGGFGIDGNLSTLLGASLAKPDQLCFGAVGDLSFFYDMNVLGNRHMTPNIRIIVVNNGKGVEFRQHINRAAQFDEATDVYIAAAGHNGNQSRYLVKHYAEDLGFIYLSASSKEEYERVMDKFVSPNHSEHPMLLEVFTDAGDEDKALMIARTVDQAMYEVNTESNTKKIIKKVLGKKGVETVKRIMNR
ncbi:MAG: 2-succinyl-5-enolpyruvyl-6-hydroxy-3-cyclohexene-1-carboxylate synthase [Clostridia bacterium]|nr:2-succinyl-5-enolpyruvyl-6-hydroxy-3-cyclohexene-1-carboxylate synthase [Clostridia bacterium]